MTHTRRARASGCPEYVTVRLAFAATRDMARQVVRPSRAGRRTFGRCGSSAQRRSWLVDTVAWIMPVARCLHLCVDVVDFGQGCGRQRACAAATMCSRAG
jgi:hypothetical protein